MSVDNFKGKTIGYVSAALGLVAGLAWNDAIKSAIEAVFPLGTGSIWAKFIYALLVTVAVVILLYYLNKFFASEDKQ